MGGGVSIYVGIFGVSFYTTMNKFKRIINLHQGMNGQMGCASTFCPTYHAHPIIKLIVMT